MVLNFYIIICVLSLICCMFFFWNKRSYYPLLYAMVYILALSAHVCYVLLALAKEVREAVIINKVIYVSGCFFSLVGLMIVISVCQIKLPKIVSFLLLLFASGVYCLSFTAGYSPIFYKSIDIEQRYGITVLVKEYGPLHSLFYVMIGLFLVTTLVVLIYGWFKKPNISKRDLAIAAFMQIFSLFNLLVFSAEDILLLYRTDGNETDRMDGFGRPRRRDRFPFDHEPYRPLQG